MRLDYADIAVMIEFIIDKASQEGKTIVTTDELIAHLDENVEGIINVLERS